MTVDEAMIKFQGRSSLKQYLPMKPTKHGIKVWVLGDANNGYFLNLSVFTGREGIYACGVARKDRKYFPPQLSDAKLKQR